MTDWITLHPGTVGAFRMAPPNGRLYVPYTYMQTTSETAVQLDAATDWIAQRFVPDVDFEISSISIRIAAEATPGVMDVDIYDAHYSTGLPSSNLGTLITGLSSGEGGAAWINSACDTNFQCEGRKEYWIVVKGTDGDDFSLSANRWNTALGSMFPDGSAGAYSTNGGTGWTAMTVDGKPACFNMVLNASANHVPPLIYGRYNGMYIYIPGYGMAEIPSAGWSATFDTDLSQHEFHMYIHYYVGPPEGLELDASNTGPTQHLEGVLTKPDDTTTRYVGRMFTKELINEGTAYKGPVDVADCRRVGNRYNQQRKLLGKFEPYAASGGATTDTGVGTSWERWNQTASSEDFKLDFFLEDNHEIELKAYAAVSCTAEKSVYTGIAIDDNNETRFEGVCGYVSTAASGVADVVPIITELRTCLSTGYHYAYPLQRSASGGVTIYYSLGAAGFPGTSGVTGSIVC